ncbi:hypothetical protein C9I57_26595 [Trinickia symbiotica]|uniref:Uncharacterized protein n=1 Tax=Trinickia symbiotica TaxID=863227 RepID=A0A2T3XMT2_9BURK|nr:hypothetical protein C9I57_26595 [Trinickia symbiotica]
MPRCRRLIGRAVEVARVSFIDLRGAWRAFLRSPERGAPAMAAALWLALLPVQAHAAGIWNGGLCTVYQSVLDNELLEIVSLTMLAGSLILWGLDDGRHNIKTGIIRGVAVTMGVLNMPLLWAQIFNHGAACTGAGL